LQSADKSWEICHLVVETGTWLSGKEIVISPSHIDRISYEESMVYVNLTRETIPQAPEFHVSTIGTGRAGIRRRVGGRPRI
jgi:hypothetical protein